MTVALIEDDRAVLESLGMLLKKRGMSVECYSSANEFLARSQTTLLSCIVSDIRMPGLSGLELQRELVKRGSTVPLILITGHGDIAMAVRAIKLGAFDFIEKPFDDQKLTESIGRAVENNERLRSHQDEIGRLVARAAELSGRQREVMYLAAKGLSNKEIALRIGISPRTVENYRAWVMEKMAARNLAELVRMAVQLEQASETDKRAKE